MLCTHYLTQDMPRLSDVQLLRRKLDEVKQRQEQGSWVADVSLTGSAVKGGVQCVVQHQIAEGVLAVLVVDTANDNKYLQPAAVLAEARRRKSCDEAAALIMEVPSCGGKLFVPVPLAPTYYVSCVVAECTTGQLYDNLIFATVYQKARLSAVCSTRRNKKSCSITISVCTGEQIKSVQWCDDKGTKVATLHTPTAGPAGKTVDVGLGAYPNGIVLQALDKNGRSAGKLEIDIPSDESSKSPHSSKATDGVQCKGTMSEVVLLRKHVMKHPLSQGVVKKLQRVFIDALAQTWMEYEPPGPQHITPRTTLHICSPKASSFLRFIDTYTKAVFLFYDHLGTTRQPLKTPQLIATLDILSCAPSPQARWGLYWYSFLLLVCSPQEVFERYLKPLKLMCSQQSHWERTHSGYYNLLKTLNGGHLTLDSLWKSFFVPGRKPSFAEVVFSLYPRTYQIAIIGKFKEVKASVHLQAYERVVKRKVRMGFALLMSTRCSVLNRYFVLLLGYAMQQQKRRTHQYRLAFELMQSSNTFLINKYYGKLKGHYLWCKEYHDRVKNSKVLMWKTNIETIHRYWRKLQYVVQTKRKRKIFLYKLEKIRVVHDRKLRKSDLLHKFYLKWLKWLLWKQQTLLLYVLLRSIRSEIKRNSFKKWLQWTVVKRATRLDSLAVLLLRETTAVRRRWAWENLRWHKDVKKVNNDHTIANTFVQNFCEQSIRTENLISDVANSKMREREFAAVMIQRAFRVKQWVGAIVLYMMPVNSHLQVLDDVSSGLQRPHDLQMITSSIWDANSQGVQPIHAVELKPIARRFATPAQCAARKIQRWWRPYYNAKRERAKKESLAKDLEQEAVASLLSVAVNRKCNMNFS
eukprot:TRINITY_DN30940_c0_g1_i1.p1 TRINITY_DN30940_c0_g1~~TRINITY_DN30940_c0_g1_i1.p1  ORF type:complete len:860 (+),score=131.08 TRINITY_DN30940_c0_g1_i1:1315-3894(+)